MRKLFTTIAILGVLASPVYGEADVNKDMAVILEEGLLNPEISGPLLQMMATQQLSEAEVELTEEALVEKFYASLSDPAVMSKLAEPFRKHFSDEELHQLSEIYKNPAFKKMNQLGPEVFPELAMQIQQVFQGMIDQAPKATAKAKAPGKTPMAVDASNFGLEVEQSELPVVVDVYADWCGPCRKLAPILAELNAEMGSSYKFVKMNADQNNELSTKFGVRGLPTLLFMKEGKEVGRMTGYADKKAVQAKIQEILG